jgi:ornithine--oxo-acid transaminase
MTKSRTNQESLDGKLVIPEREITFSELTDKLISVEEERTAHNYAPLKPELFRAKGSIVEDLDGNLFYDMLAAYSSQNQGHNHPKVQKAMIDHIQSDRIATPSRAFRHPFFVSFLKKVTEISEMDRFLPMNSGSEAVETAMKIMIKYGHDMKGIGKMLDEKTRELESIPEIIYATDNFHGRTRSISGASTSPVVYSGFGPQMPGTVIVPYGDVSEIKQAITKNTVGIMLEPIQGEAGVIIPPPGYLEKVRELATEKDVLLCFDEIQTGFGRTGKNFCWQYEDAKPDLVCMGKALSAGMYPISGVGTSDEIMSVITPGTHGSTYGGNALASVIGSAAIDVVVEEELSEASRLKGDLFRIFLRKKSFGAHEIKDIRGKGLFTAVEFYQPIAHEVVEALVPYGILAKDTHETTIRFTPPLVIGYDQIQDATDRIAKVINKDIIDNIQPYIHHAELV